MGKYQGISIQGLWASERNSRTQSLFKKLIVKGLKRYVFEAHASSSFPTKNCLHNAGGFWYYEMYEVDIARITDISYFPILRQ